MVCNHGVFVCLSVCLSVFVSVCVCVRGQDVGSNPPGPAGYRSTMCICHNILRGGGWGKKKGRSEQPTGTWRISRAQGAGIFPMACRHSLWVL